MKRNLGFQQKLLLVLITAILIVCAGFIFISCGKGPQSKIANTDKGSFALDFSNCEDGAICRALLGSPIFKQNTDKKIANKDLTIEAWVKSNVPSATTTTSTFTGGIFGRLDSAGGIALFVKNGVPKAVIRKVSGTSTSTIIDDFIVEGDATSYILDSAWHHIAAVFVNSAHSHTVSATCSASDASSIPHIDIYVDGILKGCKSTSGEFPTEPGDVFLAVGIFAENLSGRTVNGLDNAAFPGVIDEARLWGVARTESQINQCKSKELSFDSGTCGRLTSNCIGYLRLNEGAGATVNDWCGLGTGVLEQVSGSGLLSSWATGWTTNTPNLTRAD